MEPGQRWCAPRALTAEPTRQIDITMYISADVSSIHLSVVQWHRALHPAKPMLNNTVAKNCHSNKGLPNTVVISETTTLGDIPYIFQ